MGVFPAGKVKTGDKTTTVISVAEYEIKLPFTDIFRLLST
jgi:hypothetical protein